MFNTQGRYEKFREQLQLEYLKEKGDLGDQGLFG
jgi:hypothetical protein